MLPISQSEEENVLSDECKRGVEGSGVYNVYILRFTDNHLYIGQTNNLAERIQQHGSATTKSAKFTKDHGDFVLAYTKSFTSRVGAMRREKQLKGWTRAKKEALIAGDLKLLKLL